MLSSQQQKSSAKRPSFPVPGVRWVSRPSMSCLQAHRSINFCLQAKIPPTFFSLPICRYINSVILPLHLYKVCVHMYISILLLAHYMEMRSLPPNAYWPLFAMKPSKRTLGNGSSWLTLPALQRADHLPPRPGAHSSEVPYYRAAWYLE